MDPSAEGLLLLLINKATKLFQIFLNLDKEYIVKLKLGVVTDTYDIEGEIVEKRPVKLYSVEKVRMVLDKFIGEQMQVPPIHSALKHKGKPSYKYAREGKDIKLEPRKICIYSIDLLDHGRDSLVVKVECGSGTYIRSLVKDIGEKLGCGATVARLVRTRIGRYCLEDSVKVDDFVRSFKRYGRTGCLLDIGQATGNFPEIYVRGKYIKSIINGCQVCGNMIDFAQTKVAKLETGQILRIKAGSRLLAIHRATKCIDLEKIKDRQMAFTKNIVIIGG